MLRSDPVGDDGRIAQVSLRHAIGVVVVVDQGGVFVRTGYFVNAESAIATWIEVADVKPYARCLKQHFRATRQQETLIAARIDIQPNRPGDCGVDVVLRRTAGEIGRAFVTADRAPWVQGAARMVHFTRVQACAVKRAVAVFEHPAYQFRRHAHHGRQHERLGIPEVMPFIAFAGQSLGGDTAATVTAGRLIDVEQVQAQCQLGFRVAHDGQIGFAPEALERARLLLRQAVVAGRYRLLQRGIDVCQKRRIRFAAAGL